jgi:Tol biopolymer transport system component
MKYLLFCAAAGLFLFTAVRSEARLDPRLDWHTIETDHFLVHYHDGLEEIAPTAARIAEETHHRLAPVLRWTPVGRTHLVLADVVDAPNGFATPFPYNRMVIYLTPPLEQPFALTGREEWLRLVITHEYAHILHLDTVHGLPRMLRRIFGRIYFPNLFQPVWVLEGLATHEETRATDGGRGDSTYTDMILRMAVLENRFPTLAQAAIFLDTWPAGEIPYLFGVGFFQHLVEKYGEGLPGDLSENYAGRALPFQVDSTARRTFGSTFKREWRIWQGNLADHYQPLKRNRVKDWPAAEPLTDEGYRNIFPAISPSGTLIAYSSQTAHRVSTLMLASADGSGQKELMRRFVTSAGAGVSWLPDESGLVYAKLERDRFDNLEFDLYRYDLASGRETRLTRGQRAASPDVSPRSGEIVCTVSGIGRSRLALLADDGGLVRFLTGDDDSHDYFSPRWAPDGERIAVGTRAAHGAFAIHILDAEGRLLAEVPPGQGIESAPAWSPDGGTIFFSSDRSGIFNIYAYRIEEGLLYQVTDVLGGIFSPDVSPDGATLFHARYSADGFNLARLPLHPAEWRRVQAAPPVMLDEEPTLSGIPAEMKVPGRPYSPWKSLLPHYWFPWIGSDEDGLQAGAMTSGTDPLARHQYTAVLLYGTDSGRPAYSLLYQYDGFYPTVQVFAADQAVFHADFFRHAGREIDFWERRRQAGLDLVFPFSGLWTRHSLIPGYRFQRLSALTATPPDALPPAEGTLSGVRLRYLFDNSVFPPLAISPEDGRRAELAIHHDASILGSDFSRTRYSLDWREFTNLPWRRHHVAATRFFAGAAAGDILPQRAFRVGGDPPGDLLQGLDSEFLPLRGYRLNAFRGQRAVLASIEYRFPLANIERGVGNGPFFLRRLHGAAFFEGADAFDSGGPRLADFRTAAGVETRLDADLGYVLPITLRLVLARGFDQEGEDQFYLSLWFRF